MSVQKTNLIGVNINTLGTLDIEMKIGKMRKSQIFTVYPIGVNDKEITIQSDTRIGKVNMEGIGIVTKSYSGGAYFHHLSMGIKTPFEFDPIDWVKVLDKINSTDSTNTSGAITVENDGAVEFGRII